MVNLAFNCKEIKAESVKNYHGFVEIFMVHHIFWAPYPE
jgi:hypothetical protein